MPGTLLPYGGPPDESRSVLAVLSPLRACPEHCARRGHDDGRAGRLRPAVNQPPHRFDLVGLHWRGSGSVSFRTRSLAGRWSSWHDAAPEDDGPDAGTREPRRRGWELGSPYWTGPSDRIQVRTSGRVTRVRAFYVRSPVDQGGR